MKRVIAIIAIVVAVLTVAAIPTSAKPAGTTSWVGRTSQATAAYPFAADFTVVTRNGKSFIGDLYVEFLLTCEKTGALIGFGSGYSGFDTPIIDGDVRFLDNSIWDYVAWSGHIGRNHASGKLEGALPAMTSIATEKMGADLCPSGPQTWTAHPGPWTPGDQPKIVARVRIMAVKHPDGTVTRTRTVSSG